MEPSIPCGTVAKYGTHLHCVTCKEGTFSDTYDKGQCKPCTVCSTGRTVERNCSGTKNTQCGPCSHGYYDSKVVFDCLPCSVCCWDGKDQIANQCKAQGLPRQRHCKPRHERGCQTPWSSNGVQTTPAAITGRPNQRATKKNSMATTTTTTTTKTVTEEKAASLSPTTEERFIRTKTGDQNTSSDTLSTTSTELPKRTASAPYSNSKSSLAVKNSKGSLLDSSGANKDRVIKAVGVSIPILILIVVVVKRKKLGGYFKWARCHCTCGRRSSDAELGRATESSVLDATKVQSGSVVPEGGE